MCLFYKYFVEMLHQKKMQKIYQNIHKILIYIKKILTICNSKFEKI